MSAHVQRVKKLPSKTTVTLKPPHLLVHNKDELEVSIHVAPRAVLRELQQVFGGKITFEDAVVAIPTTQHTAMQMVNWGDDAAIEKDRCLEAFFAFAEEVRKKLEPHWCDYIDPCSGLPKHDKSSNCVYDEVSGHQCLLKYMVSQAGGCKVLLHPKWQTACYPATIFTTAPSNVVLEALGTWPTPTDVLKARLAEGDPTPTPLRIAQDLVQAAGAGEYWGRIQGVGGTSVGELRRLFEEVRFDDGGQLDFVPPNTRLSIKAGLDRIPPSLDARLGTNFALDSKLETLEGRKAEAEAYAREMAAARERAAIKKDAAEAKLASDNAMRELNDIRAQWNTG